MKTFENIKCKAVGKWNVLWEDEKPLILIGAATCGHSSGALQTLETFRQEITRRNIDCNIYRSWLFWTMLCRTFDGKGR